MQTLVHDSDRPVFPFDLHWDAQQLADAVPLRLFEAIDFQALHFGQYDASVNDPRMRVPGKAPGSYAPKSFHSGFRVR